MVSTKRALRSLGPVGLEELKISDRSFESSRMLPASCYTDQSFFEEELEAVFCREWLCVGRADQVPNPGDFFTITMAGEPLIVVRNKKGAVNVLSAVCRHRGMIITAPANRPEPEWTAPPPETSGNCRTFRCPYHWWTYDLDGRLVGAPEMHRTSDFSRSREALPSLRTECWNGFLFVNFDQHASPLAPRLRSLDRYLANYHVGEMVSVGSITVPGMPFNWKIMAENFMEAYHPDRLHNGIHDFAPSSLCFYEPYDEDSASLIGLMGTTNVDGGFNPTYKALFPIIPTLTDEERRRVVFAYIPPTLLLGFQSDGGFWFVVNPTGPESHDLSMAYIFPPESLSSPLFEERLQTAISGVAFFNNQDLPTNTAVQRGLRSRWAPRGRYSWQEEVLPQFNRWLVRRYSEALDGHGAPDATEPGREPLTISRHLRTNTT
jgi:phenylpropionate dioxygenase-like ring-hydroxylating dioxygenase large terminal subunit